MVNEVPSVMVKVLRPPMKSAVVDSCSSYLASEPRLPVQVIGYDFVDGDTGGAVMSGLVAAQLTVMFATVLFTLPQLFETLTQTCVLPALLMTSVLSTGPVAEAMGLVSIPGVPMNH